MRRVFHAVGFLLLIAATFVLWRHRFERIPGASSVHLADLRSYTSALPAGAQWVGGPESPVLRLGMTPGRPKIGMSIPLRGLPAVEALHVRVSVAARNLKRGAREWEDGRVLIEWRSPGDANNREMDPVCSHRENESSSGASLVVRTTRGSAIPLLRVEHLGASGEFEVSELEMIPVRERGLWKTGRWWLAGCGFAWLWLFLSGCERRLLWSGAPAAAIWLVMFVVFAVPGPWKTLHPLIKDFDLPPPPALPDKKPASPPSVPAPARDAAPGTQAAAPRTQAAVPPVPPAEASAAKPSDLSAEITMTGGLIIQIKQDLAMARPLLHALLLFAPTLASFCLVGRKRTLVLAFGLSVAIEAAQAAFGFGFDWVDVCDLIFDSLGIALAVWVYRHKLAGKLRFVRTLD